jgi:hypothetical protein
MQLHHSRSRPLVVESLEDRFLLSTSGLAAVNPSPTSVLDALASALAADSTSPAHESLAEYLPHLQTGDVVETSAASPNNGSALARLDAVLTRKAISPALGGGEPTSVAPSSLLATVNSPSFRAALDAYLRREYELGDHGPGAEEHESRLLARVETAGVLLTQPGSEGATPQTTGEVKEPGIEPMPRTAREGSCNLLGECCLAALTPISSTTPAAPRGHTALGPAADASAGLTDVTARNVPMPGGIQPIETPPPTSGGEALSEARPESGFPLAGLLPFDAAQLQQSVDAFFHTLGALGQDHEAVRLGLRAAPWIALTAVLAWEFAVHARKKPRPDTAEHGPELFAFEAGDEP